jgi:uncharacterized protein YegP (UPF0339 family)
MVYRYPGVTRVYKDQKGQWRWSTVTKTGRNVAVSGEGYGEAKFARDAAKKYGPVGFEIRVEKDHAKRT